MNLNLVIPANSGATVRLPRTHAADISKDGEPLRDGDGIVSAHEELDDTVIELAAGQYRFTYPYTPARPAL